MSRRIGMTVAKKSGGGGGRRFFGLSVPLRGCMTSASGVERGQAQANVEKML